MYLIKIERVSPKGEESEFSIITLYYHEASILTRHWTRHGYTYRIKSADKVGNTGEWSYEAGVKFMRVNQ